MNGLSWFWPCLIALAAAVTLFAQRASVSDSPWFWICLFSMAATLALFVMGEKYDHRQGHIEDEFRFGTRTLAKPPSGAPTTDPSPANANAGVPETAPLAAGPQPPTHELLISLGPLRIMVVVVMLVSWIALQWRLMRRGAGLGTRGS